MTTVLALDLATHTGWAFGSTEKGIITCGTEILPSTGDLVGRFCLSYRRWLRRKHAELKPDEWVFEAPILPSKTQPITVRKLMGLCCVTEEEAEIYSIPVFEELQQRVRVYFIGTAAAPKDIKVTAVRKMWLKQKAMEKCESVGVKAPDHNAAEACGLLALRLSQLDPDFALKQTPLFGDAA